MSDLVFHMVLFIIAGTALVMTPLLIGRLVRPNKPTAEKDAVYECGEPTIGSSFIQWDLRFYTIALLFIVFDVEVAFFFPWAAIYGNAVQLADTALEDKARQVLSARLLDQDLGSASTILPEAAKNVVITGFFDLLVFFVVLLVGFAYVWKRGDLDWIRALTKKSQQAADQTTSAA